MRIGLSCDLMRHGGDAGDAEANSAWLWPLLRPGIEKLNHELVLHTRADPVTAREVETAPFGLDPAQAWPRSYSDPALADAVRRTCRTLLTCDLVVGHELSPNQLRVLAGAGIPVIDLSIDTVRFGPELFLRIRTSDPAAAELLRRRHVPEAGLADAVAAMRERCGASADVPWPSVLFAGQTDADASLIEGARLRSVTPFVGRVRGLVQPGWRLLLKPHPYARSNADIRALHDAVPGSMIVGDNIYALLCAPEVRQVVTLSSGVADEARLFGKSAERLLRPDRDAVMPALAEGRVTLAGLTALLRERLGGDPCLLRSAVGQSWGYRVQPRPQRTVFAGQRLYFGLDAAGNDLCTLGWAPPEPQGVWSEGSFAVMLVQPREPGLVLTLDFVPFMPPGHGPVVLTVRGAAGPPIGRTLHRWRRERLRLKLPATDGPVELEFLLSSVTSPAAHGISSDRRKLGIQLRQVTVSRGAAELSRAPRRMVRAAQMAAQLALLLTGLG